jgi:hypothetical protein
VLIDGVTGSITVDAPGVGLTDRLSVTHTDCSLCGGEGLAFG